MKRRLWTLIFAIHVSLGFSCAMKATRSSEKSPRIFKFSDQELPGPMKSIPLDQASVILDVRSAFDYSLAHIPNSINLQWDEFSEQSTAYKGKLQSDLFSISTRLARIGVDLDSKVLVVGTGIKGGGEEGRIAWMLAYLGVKQVSFIDISSLKARMINTTQEQNKSTPIWKPKTLDSILCSTKEFLFAVNKQGLTNAISYLGLSPRLYKIIDVRSEPEYLGRGTIDEDVIATPDVGAINIEWKQFFSKQGLPRNNIKKQLLDIGVKPEHRILVIDSKGVRSAAATMALLNLGFMNAANCASGWREVIERNE